MKPHETVLVLEGCCTFSSFRNISPTPTTTERNIESQRKTLEALFTLLTFVSHSLCRQIFLFPSTMQFPFSLLRATTEREGNVSRKTKYHEGGLKRMKSEKRRFLSWTFVTLFTREQMRSFRFQ